MDFSELRAKLKETLGDVLGTDLENKTDKIDGEMIADEDILAISHKLGDALSEINGDIAEVIGERVGARIAGTPGAEVGGRIAEEVADRVTNLLRRRIRERIEARLAE